MRLRYQVLFLLFLCCGLSSCYSVFYAVIGNANNESLPKMAERLRKEEKFDEAVEAYKRHIEIRQKARSRPETENPYFYFLFIGDTYLEAKKPNPAEEAYGIAKNEKVDSALVISRFHQLGQWYETQGNLSQAMSIFKRYRELDPMVFDYDIDRIHKLMVEQEYSPQGPLQK